MEYKVAGGDDGDRTRDLMRDRKPTNSHAFHSILGFSWPYTNLGLLLSLKSEAVFFQLRGILEHFWNSLSLDNGKVML